MDTELLFTIATKGTYYYPASNKYLVNKKDYGSDYGVINMTIDDIKFDMCTRINGFTTFDTLTDFVCNNLYFDINGNIHIRVKCDYSIEDIIEQIKNKKLINMLNKEFIQKECLEYWNPDDTDFYEKKWKYREDKMLSYGYNY